jgi:hypothetical protein
MVGGGANMIPAAMPLTWVSDLVSLRPTGKTIAQWREGLGGGDCVCIGIDAMLTRLRRELDSAFAGQTPDDEAHRLHALMQDKSPRELACVAAASAVLQAAVDAMRDAHRSRDGVTGVVLAGEHAAIKHEAQDVRTLFSLDGGGTYRPFSVPVETVIDPLVVYIAVCRFGYWVDGVVALAGGSAMLRSPA